MKYNKNIEFQRIIIAAYRLPFKFVKKDNEYRAVQSTGGLVSAILSLAGKIDPGQKKRLKIVWVGTGEHHHADVNISTDIELVPVDIPRKINDKYYGGFCNDTIWPLFHYFPNRTVYDNSYYDAYSTANELYFESIKTLLKPGDFVWVHDYQLFLLPDMIRNSFPEADIGFFLHIPFPSFEIFRLLPRKWRESILRGITGANVVGFHTSDYTHYFLRSVEKIFGYKEDQNVIHMENRLCKVETFPIGIDFDKFHNACLTRKTINRKKKLLCYIGDKKLVFSVDRLDYSKGFLNRLHAYERFLERYPEWHNKVIFNMVIVPSRDNIEGYRLIKGEIESNVGRINGKYSNLEWRPLIYQYKSIPFNELVALYNISDVALITPIRDGMNLVAKEYVACQTDKHGMLVLSEMAGAAAELKETIIINPNDIEETADAIDKALCMPEGEKEEKIHIMQERLKRYNVFVWSADFFRHVTALKKKQKRTYRKRSENQ